ncbi:MAG: glycoside hydrolase family 16 protein [Spirochaetales bacterium]|nr:glycoside hydrolase family 16 protein [Spirochaetales bacterium]
MWTSASFASFGRACLFLCLFAACQSPPPVEDYTTGEEWTLVWADEFDGSELDREKWSYDVGGHGFGNHELQYYTFEDNLQVKKGLLTIEARKEKYKGNPYTSSKIWTMGKAGWTYGRFVMRARLPQGQGIWPAFWMLPMDPYAMKWPAGGEIDIMEMVGHEPATIHGTVHYGDPHEYKGGKITLKEGQFSDDFHIFSIEWEPGKITWFLDGEPYYSQTEWFSKDLYNREEYAYPAPFDKDFMIILNLAVGGEWPGPPDSTTPFPQTLEVDFVRVYQKCP